MSLERVKPIIRKVLPDSAFQALRSLRHKHIFELAGLMENTVIDGPFKGMRYPRACVLPYASSGKVLLKLLGGYESECSSFVEQAIAKGYKQFVNIGTGEGYYAVGLALRLRTAAVVGFEANPGNRMLCSKLAQANAVAERIQLFGFCTVELLRQVLQPDALVICDCEGGELELLQPDLIPNLLTADLLVELHDFVNPEISRTVLSRFRPSHTLQIAKSQPRKAEDFPLLKGLSASDREHFLLETRAAQMEWAFFTRPKEEAY